MPSLIVKQSKDIQMPVKSDKSDIIKKFDNIKMMMDSVKSRIFIHEFVNLDEKKVETYDKEVDYDLIYA